MKTKGKTEAVPFYRFQLPHHIPGQLCTGIALALKLQSCIPANFFTADQTERVNQKCILTQLELSLSSRFQDIAIPIQQFSFYFCVAIWLLLWEKIDFWKIGLHSIYNLNPNLQYFVLILTLPQNTNWELWKNVQ